ncbi:hypothetical protein [Ornithinibacillus scapharcae]|uniref:hypothetical protein n=1 Tax=Ornithinibacillus scapharcae TaxID=1147159 RepID=UPI00110FE5A0|nr:hypothetical protein [Ornithinibacillus scapharcae]
MKRTHFNAILFLILLIVIATGCSEDKSKPDKKRIVSEASINLFEVDKIDLSGKSYAMIFSADLWNEDDQENGRNVLLLFDDEGKWDAYKTYNLDRANVNWTEDGLYLSDYKYEYYINNEGEVEKAEKTTDLLEGTAQYGSSVDDDGGVWSWFDIGFSEDGYDTRITYQHKGERKETIVEGVYSYLFTAGTQLYGVSSSFDLPNGINKGGHMGLVEFVGDDLKPKVLSSHQLPNPDMEPVVISQQVAQKDDTVHVIGEAEVVNDEVQTNLMKWNIQEGTFELDRIAVSTDHYGNELSSYTYYTDQQALVGNELYWFNERAELMKTNIDTNKTELVQSYDIKVQNEMFYTARIVNDSIYLIVNDTTWGDSSDREGTKMRLIKTSLSSPDKFTIVDITEGKKLAKLFSKQSLTPTNNSFAVRPTSDN